jgi:methyltransferase-like protein
MLIRELAGDDDSTPSHSVEDDSSLVTTLEFLRNRAHNQKITPVISTRSLINMVNNMGGSEFFNYENLKAAQEQNPVVKELIKNLDRDKVTLKTFGDEIDAPESEESAMDSDPGTTPSPELTVKKMAKRALGNRS